MPMSYGRLNKNDHNFPRGAQWADRMRRAIDTDLKPRFGPNFFDANGALSIEQNIIFVFCVVDHHHLRSPLSVHTLPISVLRASPGGTKGQICHCACPIGPPLSTNSPTNPTSPSFNCSLNHCRNCHATDRHI